MKDFGYDVSDYCDVDPMFGTLADFDALIAEAHRLGLKVMIDQVLSHTSDQHPWFQESRAEPRQPQGRLVRLGRRQARRHAAQQLAVDLRRLGLAVGHAPPPVLPAQFPGRAARPQFPQPRRCRTRCSTQRASGSSAASTASASTPSTSTSTARAAQTIRRPPTQRNRPTAPAVNPYNYPGASSTTRASPRISAFLRALPRAARRVSGDSRGRRGRRRRSAR